MGIFDRWARSERKSKEQTRHSPLELMGIKNDALLEVVAAKDTTIKALKVGIMAWEKSVKGIIDMEKLGLIERPPIELPGDGDYVDLAMGIFGDVIPNNPLAKAAINKFLNNPKERKKLNDKAEKALNTLSQPKKEITDVDPNIQESGR